MFAYLFLRPTTPERERARHFEFPDQSRCDWNRLALGMVMMALVFGGCAKLAGMPLAGFALSLLLAVAWVTPSPTAEFSGWAARGALACVVLFYLGLGYCFGAFALLGLAGVALLRRAD